METRWRVGASAQTEAGEYNREQATARESEEAVTYYLLGIATGVAVTYGVLNFAVLKAKVEAWRKK